MRKKTWRRLVPAAAIALSVLAQGGAASAATDEEKAGARAAAEQGAKALQDGRYDVAIDMLSRAEALIHAPTHLVLLAKAHERLGKLVKARELYLRVSREDLAPEAPAAFKQAKATAINELTTLDGRIPYVSVVVQGAGAANVRVTQDGVRVPDALVGVPRPVDPGEHKLQAVADGMESAINTVLVREGARETVVLTLQPRDVTAALPVTAPPAAAPSSTPVAPPVAAHPPTTAPALSSASSVPAASDTGAAKTASGVSGLRIASYAALGVGVAGLAVGTIFLVKSNGASSDANKAFDDCDLRGCSPSERANIASLDDDASGAKTGAIVGYTVGGAGVVAGVTLLLLDRHKKAPKSASGTIVPWMGYQSAGLVGTF
jgi:hypothetical protein